MRLAWLNGGGKIKRIVARDVGPTSAVVRTVPIMDRSKYHCLDGMSGAGVSAFEAIRIVSYDDLTQLFMNRVAAQLSARELADYAGACRRFAWGDSVALSFPWAGGKRPLVQEVASEALAGAFPCFAGLDLVKKLVLVFAIESRGAAPVNGVLWRIKKDLSNLTLLNRQGVGFNLENHGPHPQEVGDATIPDLKATFAIEVDTVRQIAWDGQ